MWHQNDSYAGKEQVEGNCMECRDRNIWRNRSVGVCVSACICTAVIITKRWCRERHSVTVYWVGDKLSSDRWSNGGTSEMDDVIWTGICNCCYSNRNQEIQKRQERINICCGNAGCSVGTCYYGSC